MAQPSFPCRLFVIPARGVPVAIILRRGPSKWYHVIRWQMDTDTFELGAWLRGKIYEEKCDLSPDGNLMVYSCHGGAIRPGYTDSWTAVSRAPWLYALTLWPQGTTYGGGGRFLTNRELSLHSFNRPQKTHPDHPVRGLKIVDGDPLYHQSTAEVKDADWSGRDHAGCLIFCRHGKLFRRGRWGRDREIADFNGLRPDPQPAPDWAKKVLGR